MKTVFFKSKWIWLHEEKVNHYVDFRTVFSFSGKDALLRISADTNYALFINGKFIYSGQYPDYPAYKIYDEFSVGEYCRYGENILAVLGWSAGEDSSTYRRERAGVIFEVESDGEIIAYSGKHVQSREDLCYRSGETEKISPQIGFSFWYDATREDDWINGGGDGFLYSAEVVKNCKMFPRPDDRLRLSLNMRAVMCSQGEALFKGEFATAAQTASEVFLKHKPIDAMGNEFTEKALLPSDRGWRLRSEECGVYAVADMGEEVSGYVCLDLEVPEDTDVIVAFGEHLQDLRVRSYIGGRNFAFTYRAHRGRNVWCGYLRRMGLRYLQICSQCGEMLLHDCRVMLTEKEVRQAPVNICDGLFRIIDRNGIRTLKNCMHEHYEDCPWREQSLYAMDSRNQMLFGYYVFEKNSFAQSNLRLMAEGLREDGLLELCFPARVGVTIPSFSLYYVIAFAENYRYTGDGKFAAKIFPVAKKIMESFNKRRDATGLIPVFSEKPYWNFYEWKDGLDGGMIFRENVLPLKYDSCLNLLYLYALQQMSLYCSSQKISDKYGGEASLMKDAIKTVFYDEERRAFAAVNEKDKKSVYAQLPQALALMTDCFPDAEETLISSLTERKDLITLSLSNKVWAYDALLKTGKKYLDFVLEDIKNTFGDMAVKGDTTLYETEVGVNDFYMAGSLCHGWSAVPCYVFRRYAKGMI